MAKNNSQPGEVPEGTGAREEEEARAKAAEEAARAEAAAKAEAEAKARAEAEAAKAGTKPAMLRHKTQYPKYRCAGLALTQRTETYQVTEAQLEKLRLDPWVVIEQDKKKEPEEK
ncbi:MAG: hypothetical protein LBT87_04745 [Treponema sp.]|jgi:regulator of protease activity HflC (stomatin/prohibitin superfamily)|nr:hypothetical protein [Treponema sp.]